MALLMAWLLSSAAAQATGEEMVRLDLPETVEVKVLVDYVSSALGLNVIADETLLGKRVALRVNAAVPKSSLLSLLRSVLRGRGLALLPSDQPGWFKIVPAEQLPAEAGAPRRDLADLADDSSVVTYVLPVRHADLQRMSAGLTPYLSKPGGTLTAVSEGSLLLVTDYVRNLARVVEVAKLLDVAPAGPRVESIPVRHQSPAALATLVLGVMSEMTEPVTKLAGRAPLGLQPDPIGGGLLAVGMPDQIERARALVERFDVPSDRYTELYQPRFITASRVSGLIDQMLPGSGAQLTPDDSSNTLFVTASLETQARISKLLARFDSAPPQSATPLRFYKLMNRRADDVFATLGGLLGGQATTAPANQTPKLETEVGLRRNRPPLAPPGAGQPGGGSAARLEDAARQGEELGATAPRVTAIRGENFSLSLDEHTNSILVIATPELHQQIEHLIEQLDKRRPQVLVEVTLVSISADESLNLGVELEAIDLGDPLDYLLFTSFGLSNINPTDGTRRLNVLPGGTGVLLAPDEVPIIVQALASRGDTKVYSAPRILVDDNATGRLESVAESPFTSVNASDTVATTSFAGFAKAGTQLSIEPHIAEGDHLEINYSLTVSSFTGAGTGTAPPPRSSDTLSSTIRVPDGHTVIVGGLLTETLGESSSHVPLVGDIPLIGWLFGTRSDSRSKVRLYAFIRPTVLRDDRFEDLKYLSLQDLEAANVQDGFPPTRLQIMR